MICLTHTIKAKSRSDKFVLIPLGDTHFGYIGVDEDKFDAIVDYIARTPNVYVLGMGDYSECINMSDIRFDPRFVAPWCRDKLDDLVKTQAKYFVKKVWKIRKKIIGLIGGNHEDLIRRRYHQDIMGSICVDLGVPNLSMTTMIRLQFSRQKHSTKTVKIYAMHGYGGARTETGSLNKILNKGKEFDADIYLMGHDHFFVSTSKIQIAMTQSDPPVAVEHKRIFAVTGSFRLAYPNSSYSDYAEQKGYPPVRTGCHKIVIEPFRKVYTDGRKIETLPHLHIWE